jgi:MoaA/NifB/PqqE/SkfB family radical SAM enzyme
MKNPSRTLYRYFREAKFITTSLLSTKQAVLAHIIPMRRCNLACGYCNEYDKVSDPVPFETMTQRLDKLRSLGVSLIIISGGEPTLHPQLDDIIRHARGLGMLVGLITNGYYLTKERIERLNNAGLDYLQISVDNVVPDKVSQKSLKVIDRYLVNLSKHAKFHVNINSVLGGGVRNPDDALTVARRAVELGFSSSLGIIHDHTGQLKPMGEREEQIYQELKNFGKTSWTRLNRFQEDLAYGRPHNWRCRAGARYLYICEDGLVHYCSQQRGYPGVPLEDYTLEDVRREFYTEKPCAKFCTIACVQQVAMFDNWRAPQVRQYDPETDRKTKVEGGLVEDPLGAEL